MRIVNADSSETMELVRELFSGIFGFAGSGPFVPKLYPGIGRSPRRLCATQRTVASGVRRFTGCRMRRTATHRRNRVRDETCIPPSGVSWQGAGRELVETLIGSAREIGYKRLRLDTLPSMTRAKEMYRSLCFREIAPYRVNPVPGASFMELNLLA